MTRTSLATHVIGHLMVAQIVAFSIGWIVSIGLGLHGYGEIYFTLDQFATTRTEKFVVASLTRGEDGAARFEPTAELIGEMEQNPRLKFAAFDMARNEAAGGSSSDLLPVFVDRGSVKTLSMDFTFANDAELVSPGYMTLLDTPVGRFRIAIHGYKFQLQDVFHAYKSNAEDHLYYFLIPLALSIGAGWVAVRRGLTPLHAIARSAASIDMDSLNQRLPAAGVPTEVVPLVDAMNKALTRLDSDAAKMRRFSANAAHELRTPIAILTARLDAPRDAHFMAGLEADVRRIHNIVEQMLATMRISAHHERFDQIVDIVSVVSEIASDSALLAIKSKRQIVFEAPESPVLVRGNRTALQSIVANLIDNAVRAEPENGAVMIRVGEDRTVAVSDHGDGVDPGDCENIFEPFWRKTDAVSGAGLGLAISKELMEAHGGRIWVEKTPGGGATLKLAFP